jgi:hypothetical protein
VPHRAALAALALAVGSSLAGCGSGGSGSDDDLVLPTTITSGFAGGQGQNAQGSTFQSRSAMMANTTMSRKLLSGRLRPPHGFTVLSVNPSVPLSAPADGEVRAVVRSPTGVEYVVTFGPTTVPCVGPTCGGASSRSVPVGSANPSSSSAVFAPDIGRSAECGFDPEGPEVGCDSIVDDEYVAVHGIATSVSTADAVAVLKAAIAYVQTVSAGK